MDLVLCEDGGGSASWRARRVEVDGMKWRVLSISVAVRAGGLKPRPAGGIFSISAAESSKGSGGW